MTPTPPRTETVVDETRKALEETQLRERMRAIRRRLLILSGKGGVGKSTVAVNLAVALAQAGETVGLLDVDVHGPSVPRLTGLDGRTVSLDGSTILPAPFMDRLTVMSIGFFLKRPSDAVIWRGPLKFQMIRQFLKDVAWGRLDSLVVDCPPGTGDEPLSVVQLAGSPAVAVVVTTPQEVSIADVRRCVTFCNSLSVPVLGIVENMSGLVCPSCGAEIDLFKRGGGEDLARETGVPFLGRIPIDPAIVSSGDDGTPFVRDRASTPAASAFLELAARIREPAADRTR
ncbi:MAG: Mrp/NBP35 family ATP-binding protein [bacterium]